MAYHDDGYDSFMFEQAMSHDYNYPMMPSRMGPPLGGGAYDPGVGAYEGLFDDRLIEAMAHERGVELRPHYWPRNEREFLGMYPGTNYSERLEPVYTSGEGGYGQPSSLLTSGFEWHRVPQAMGHLPRRDRDGNPDHGSWLGWQPGLPEGAVDYVTLDDMDWLLNGDAEFDGGWGYWG